MKKIVLVYGAIAGAIVSVMMILTLGMRDEIDFENGMVIGYATMLAAFLLIYFGIRSYRDTVGGGSVAFGRAFTVGAMIAVVASVMYVATWEVIYFNFHPDFLEQYQAHELAAARAQGASQAELDRKAGEMAAMAEQYKNPVFNVAFTLLEILPLGLLVSLVTAFALSRKRGAASLAAAH